MNATFQSRLLLISPISLMSVRQTVDRLDIAATERTLTQQGEEPVQYTHGCRWMDVWMVGWLVSWLVGRLVV